MIELTLQSSEIIDGKYIRKHTGYSPGEYRRFLIDDRNASQI